MRILITTCYNKASGMGHWVRSLALAEAALGRDHQVIFCSDHDPDRWWKGIRHVAIRPEAPGEISNILLGFKPDWVIVDWPDSSHFVYELVPEEVRICTIDGVGMNYVGHQRVDLNISQGLNPKDEYRAPDHLILRPELFRRHESRQSDGKWLVFGGSADLIGLLPLFHRACSDEEALLLITELTPDPAIWLDSVVSNHWIAKAKDEGIIGLMQGCSRAVVHMGMMVWELIALGKGVFVVSRSKQHLEDAMRMDRLGYIKAWPKVGLPGPDEFYDFILQPFEPGNDLIIDGQGAERVIKLLERN